MKQQCPFWLALFLATTAPACNVPVFRYALERWNADAYEVTVFRREPLSAESRPIVDALAHTASNTLANLTLEIVDVSRELPSPLRTLWQTQTNAPLPWMLVRYPASTHIEQPVWAGPLDAEIVRTLVDSPARRELVRRLTQGDSAVWLLLDGEAKEANDAAGRLLESESRKLEKSMKLPEAAPDDPQMRSDLPLKIAFPTVRVSRANPAERMLVNQLLNVAPDLAAVAGPMVYAIMGRGRALPPLSGQHLSGEYLSRVAEFVAGACSCEVKSMNPGFDLLLAADWDALVEGRVAKDPELPPLIGISQFAAAPTNRPVLPLAAAGPGASSSGASSIVQNTLLVLGLGAVALILATLLLKARRSRR